MRAFLIALALVAAGAAMPSAGAAESFFTDAADDVQAEVATEPGSPLPGIPGSASDSAKASDLLSLSIIETPDTLDLTIQVVAMQGTNYFADVVTELGWGDKDYRVSVSYFGGSLAGGSSGSAQLLVRQGAEWEYIAVLERPLIDAAAATATVKVPKVYLVDEKKRIPGRGDEISVDGVFANSNYVNFGLASTRFTDRMPDEPGSTPFKLALGDYSLGDLTLSTPDRVRVSNGGATTFVFKVELRNLGAAPESYALAATDLPSGWNATLQTPVKVPAKETRTVNVLVSVPFAHEHGGYSSFNITAQAQGDPGSQGKLRLGVLHTPIPQPAGHHRELYLHTADPRSGELGSVFSTVFPFSSGWMNTMADHTEDAPFMTPQATEGTLQWTIPLSPRLQMGLDFDVDDLGELKASIEGKRDVTADITADLWYYSASEDSDILLAEGAPASITLTQSGMTDFTVKLTPTEEADYIAYEPNARMYLVLTLSVGEFADQINHPLRPQLDTASFELTLPLNEYHDKLSGASEAAQSVDLIARDLVEKVGRPGTVLTYTFDVKNNGPAATFVFDLAGNDISHATLVPWGEFPLASGATRNVTVAVEIPISSNPGQEYEVLVFVHAKDDPSKMAIARTKTRTAAEGEDAMRDESAQLLAAQARENQTPGPGVALALVAISASVLLARRERRG